MGFKKNGSDKKDFQFGGAPLSVEVSNNDQIKLYVKPLITTNGLKIIVKGPWRGTNVSNTIVKHFSKSSKSEFYVASFQVTCDARQGEFQTGRTPRITSDIWGSRKTLAFDLKMTAAP